MILRFRRPLLATVAWIAIGGVACAAEPAPDLAIKNKQVEARVYLGDKIKADPVLTADCLAEGKKWAERQRAEAETSRRQDPEMFRGGAWSFERKYDFRSVIGGRYVSVIRSDYMDTGGAHPNSDVDTILWDTTTKKRISIRPFFTETADGGPTMKAMQAAVVAALKAEKKQRDIDASGEIDLYKGIEPKLLKIGAVTLAPSTQYAKSSGLTFHYPPDAVGSRAEGGYVAFVPWEKFKPYLTAEGVAIFGGARPAGDDDPQ